MDEFAKRNVFSSYTRNLSNNSLKTNTHYTLDKLWNHSVNTWRNPQGSIWLQFALFLQIIGTNHMDNVGTIVAFS